MTGAGSFTITRNAGNGLPEAVTGGLFNLTRTFNDYGEIEGENFIVNSQSLNLWNLVRDKTGRITSKTEVIGGATSNYVYSYDSMGRLLTVSKDGALIEEYQYDTIGRRTYEMNVLKGITGRTFTYSDEDHLLTAGDINYLHNADGFMTNKTHGVDVTTYNYSSRGELLNVNLPDGTVIEYINDPLGRRIAKKVSGVVVEKYLWQGLNQLLAVYDGSNNLMMRFEYADGRMPVAMIKVGVTYYLTYDQVGSLKVISDASGNVIKRIDYDSFGNIINDSNPSFEVPFTFAGGLYDKDTSLIRFGFRDYNTDTGRWTAKDPIGFWGIDVDLYGYVGNNPVSFVDSYGLEMLLLGRQPFIFRYPGVSRPAPSQRYISPRPTSPIRPTTPRTYEPPPQPTPCPVPEPSWWGRFLKDIADLLDELGLGSRPTPTLPYDPFNPYSIPDA